MAEQAAKPWQIAVIVMALVVVLGVAAYSFLFSGSDVRFASSVTMVDVSTGELFDFDVGGGKAIFPPEVNPNTGKRALLPAQKDEDGKWRISKRYLRDLTETESPADAVVNKSDGEVRVKSESISRGR